MNIVETRQKKENAFLAEWLVAAGAIKFPEEQRLLAEPGRRVTFSNEGFDPVREVEFLKRVDGFQAQKEMLAQEVLKQLGEDFGKVEHVAWYKWENGKVVIPKLGRLSEVTEKGGVESEIVAVKTIEEMLAEHPESVVVHMSPENEKLGYKFKCVDFWRIVNDEANSVRIMVVENEAAMRKVWKMLNGGVELDLKKDLLANPVQSEMKPAELFNLFELAESKNDLKYQRIENIVRRMLSKLEMEYGSKIVKDPEVVARLYSAAYGTLEDEINRGMHGKYRESDEAVERKLNHMVTALMTEKKKKPSSGCSASTMVNGFAEGRGMVIIQTADGIVIREGSTAGLKFCDKCGCYYSGPSCPLCSRS